MLNPWDLQSLPSLEEYERWVDARDLLEEAWCRGLWHHKFHISQVTSEAAYSQFRILKCKEEVQIGDTMCVKMLCKL